MKKFKCNTKVDGYVKGEMYRLDENDTRIKLLARLNYISEVPMNYKKKKQEVKLK